MSSWPTWIRPSGRLCTIVSVPTTRRYDSGWNRCWHPDKRWLGTAPQGRW
ncbi:MAG: hypothetical protein R3F15_13535 [Lysobacterales bacterium]